MKTNNKAIRDPKYWRSLDELADSPSFQPWIEREFPEGASELLDPQSRRDFVKVMGASLLLGGLATGCRRPVEHIEPYAKLPDGYIHGVSQYYATSMPTRSGAVPLVVRSHEGRPVKIEGNAQKDVAGWNGGTTAHAQASILDLYDPDRATRFMANGSSIQREVALNSLNTTASQLGQGQGLAILAERSFSPTRLRLQKIIAQKYPQSKWFTYESGEGQGINGLKARPVYNFEKATRILSLDCDFLGTEDESQSSCRGYTAGRKIREKGDAMNRLYVVEALMTLTGAAADHRLRKNAAAIPSVALEFAEAIVNKKASNTPWIAECVKDLQSAQGKALVVAGYRQPPSVHALAHAMNAALGAEGNTVSWMPLADTTEGNIADLVQSLNGGQVGTLVILGGNPSYAAPADLDFDAAKKKAKSVIRVGYYEDETSEGATTYLAEAHYLESWGDSRTADGRVCAVQPLIAPLFGGVTQIEVLARLAGLPQTTPYELTRETFSQLAGGSNEDAWKKFLHDGYLASGKLEPVSSGVTAAQFFAAGSGAIKAVPAPGKDSLEVVFYRDGKVDDGRYNNNAWLQELPDTISKVTWDNMIYVSKKTGEDLGLDFEVLAAKNKNMASHGLEQTPQKEAAENMIPVVTVSVNGKKITGPCWVQPGLADNTLAIAVGYGRRKTGRIGTGVGFDVNPIRSNASPFLATGAKLSATGETYRLAQTQEHWSMEGRAIVREANYEQFQEKPDFAKELDAEAPPGGNRPLYPNPFDKAKSDIHQWGMSIDLNSCTGCGACVMACQSENNIPVVGKRQVANGREMHWLRIDRYFTGTVAEPQVVTQPMLCQHCEAAPCENVCPVNATAHDHEGLNVMAYNRCVGTRYCSNNCPYKVRRFNYFDYNKRDLTRLYDTPLDPRNKRPGGESEIIAWFKSPETGNKPAEEWELLKLVKNPDVSVRMRGVMEKCTYCTQRIEGAKIAQKVKAKTSGDVRVPDGAFTTACAQACPTEAIVFGNILDPESKVSKAKNQDRTYTVLDFLLTKPRTTYLARVRNPNPAMPDGKEKYPYSTKEYSDYMGDPFNEGHGHGAEHAEGGHAEGHAAESHAAPAGAKKGAE